MEYPDYDLYGVLGFDPSDPHVYEIDEVAIRRAIRECIAATDNPADRSRIALATRVLGNIRTRNEYDAWRSQKLQQPQLASWDAEVPVPAAPSIEYSLDEERAYDARIQRLLGPHWQSNYPEFRPGSIRYQLSELRDRYSLAMETRVSGRMQSMQFRWQLSLESSYWRFRVSLENRYWATRFRLEHRRDQISWWLEENRLRWVLVALIPIMVVLLVLLGLDLTHTL